MNDLQAMLNTTDRPKILVLGDIILDQCRWVTARQPGHDSCAPNDEMNDVQLDGAAHTARILIALNAEVSLAGVIGDDDDGRIILQLLEEAGIDASLVQSVEDRPTVTHDRVSSRDDADQPYRLQQVTRAMGQILTDDVQQSMTKQILDRLTNFDAVHVSDHANGVCRSAYTTKTYRYIGSSPERTDIDSSDWEVDAEPTETTLAKTIAQASKEYGIRILVESDLIAIANAIAAQAQAH